MFRSVTYSSADLYCRYLDISLCHGYCSGVCGGRFGYYLKDNFGLEKLPYDLKLSKLLIAGALSPDLFVKLPISFFKKWTNFPECPASWQSDRSEIEENVGKYNIHYFPSDNFDFSNFLHPYDFAPLNQEFVKQFKANIPKRINLVRMPENRCFQPFEAYFAYWRGYVLTDALIGYGDIERILSEKHGLIKIIERISLVNQYWDRKYKDIFQRLSLYRTAMSILVSRNTKNELAYKEISEFLLSFSRATVSTLEADMEQLLILYYRWQCEIDRNGSTKLKKASELLKQDIYFLLDWLCTSTDLGEKYYFKKWSYEHWRTAEWAQLKDIIAYEELELNSTFFRYIKFYCEEIKEFIDAGRLEKTYASLCEIDSFAPWIRSFSEMHKSINNKSIINFKQPRILDHLIIMTIRTEIVIRDMYLKYLKKKDSPDQLLKVLTGLRVGIKDSGYVKVLEFIHNDWSKTKLNDKPEDIFGKIDSIEAKKCWNKQMMHFYRQLLKFVTSRNYFAHHSYKDESLNTRSEALTADVLKSCVQSLLFLDSLLRESSLELDCVDVGIE